MLQASSQIQDQIKSLLKSDTRMAHLYGLVESIATSSLFCSSLIEALIVQINMDYAPKSYQGALILWL